MISSRRLAREWALKILYQMDVGKVSLHEARDTALDRLRMEFVQRGSRSASGSTAEMVSLDFVTSLLTPSLNIFRPAFERAVLLCTGRAFQSAAYVQEVWFEKAFKSRIKGVRLLPARLLVPASEEPVYGKDDAAGNSALTAAEKAVVGQYMQDIVETLPKLFEKEMKKTALLFAKQIQQERLIVDMTDAELLARRREFNDLSEERWQKVSQMVQKQTSDWLHVAGFAVRLIDCMEKHQPDVDAVLTSLSSGWKLERQVAVDRNIMRLAAMEILYLPEIPASASINEAVELAKKFSTAESGRFVNGVLGAVADRTGEKSTAQPSVQEEDLIEDLIDMTDVADMDDSDLEIEAAELQEEADIDFEE